MRKSDSKRQSAVDPFQTFIAQRAANFRRLAYASKVETVDDLYSDAWLVADEIERNRGTPVDFLDPTDQNMVMSWLYIRKVTRRDRVLRSALSIEETSDSNDRTISILDRLHASPMSDPLTQLLSRESELELSDVMATSFSEVVAYVRTFERFKHRFVDVCAHLAVPRQTLTSRIGVAVLKFKTQRSLFDGKSKISSRFRPPPGRRYQDGPVTRLISSQWGWDFEAEPGAGRVLTTA